MTRRGKRDLIILPPLSGGMIALMAHFIVQTEPSYWWIPIPIGVVVAFVIGIGLWKEEQEK